MPKWTRASRSGSGLTGGCLLNFVLLGYPTKFAYQCLVNLPGDPRHDLGMLLWRTTTLVRQFSATRHSSYSASRDPCRCRDVRWHILRERGWLPRRSVCKTPVSGFLSPIRVFPSYISPANSIGDLRFRYPELYGPYSGIVDATKSGPSCSQLHPKVVIPEGLSPQAIGYTRGIHAVDDDSEDCKHPSALP